MKPTATDRACPDATPRRPPRELRLLRRAALTLLLLATLALVVSVRMLHGSAPAAADPLGATAAAVAGGRAGQLTVTSLRAGGPLAQAGLRVGDVVEAADGRALASLAEPALAVAAGRRVDLRVRRGAAEYDVLVEGLETDGYGAQNPAGRRR